MKKAASLVYVFGVIACGLLTPLFAILVVFKLCDATPLAWVHVCIPLVIVIALSPLLAAAKFIVDAGGKK